MTRPAVLAAAALFALVAGAARPGLSASAGSKSPARAGAKPAAGKPKGKSKTAVKPAKDPPPGDPAPTPVPGSKVAVFAFAGDDGEALRRQVLRLLRAKGLKTDTSLKPLFDSAEQYRETAGALGLVAYIDGELAAAGPDASATIFVRNGATGLRIWSATFTGDRRQLANEVSRQLWDQWSPALGRACADAAKRKPDRQPLRIDAGTPIADRPPE